METYDSMPMKKYKILRKVLFLIGVSLGLAHHCRQTKSLFGQNLAIHRELCTLIASLAVNAF